MPKRNAKGQRPHPTQSRDMEYTGDQVEFIMAMEAHRRAHGQDQPGPRDILAVAHRLGYRQRVPGP